MLVRFKGSAAIAGLDDLEGALSRYKPGQQVELLVNRSGTETEVPVKLGEYGSPVSAEGAAQALQAARLAELRQLVPTNPVNKVAVNAGEVGGPSAGLMFALETIDLLTPGDLTKGLQIAGTGTINASGEVGAIGGISHKVVAAERKGAELFLAPEANAKEAAAKAKSMGSSMKVVRVRTLDEAVQAIQTFRASY
ncbi:S16 family serine protease [Paenibacillus protaetiae]|uniref:endopeptidase La n=1 Tax=Paenibacillus protaetiae TaxID=2509456 RepID=A0A4P6EU05_9BACL|nr:S16 family serine protease [Paenibacillus protaetiae]QAY65563.1 hypothetical protein ET464_03370 [Paenibacillus protaetiae]